MHAHPRAHTCMHTHTNTADLPWDYSGPVHAKVSLGYLQYWQDNDDTSQFPRESPLPGGPYSPEEMGIKTI